MESRMYRVFEGLNGVVYFGGPPGPCWIFATYEQMVDLISGYPQLTFEPVLDQTGNHIRGYEKSGDYVLPRDFAHMYFWLALHYRNSDGNRQDHRV